MSARVPNANEGSETVATLRRHLTETYSSYDRSFPLPFEEGLRLLEETAAAYDSGCHDLVAIGCRSVVESACYLYFGTRWEGTGWSYRLLPRKVNGDLREVGFAELLDAVTSEHLLSRQEIESMKRIQLHGNFVAHYGSRLIRESEAAVRAEARYYLASQANAGAPEVSHSFEPRTGIQHAEALRDTATIVSLFMSAAERRFSSGTGRT